MTHQTARAAGSALRGLLLTTILAATPLAASAVDLEVTHWWTSGGEAAAVRELAAAFEAETGNHWVDGAIAGSGSVARPVIISRILGGDPMGATQLNHGQQAHELIEAGLLLDLTEVAEANHWRDVIRPSSLLDSCTVDGHIYCAPLNIHSTQWTWISNAALARAGVGPIHSWSDLVAAAPALRAAGVQPLIIGTQSWQYDILFNNLLSGLGGQDLYYAVYRDRDEATLHGDALRAVFEQAVVARGLTEGSAVQQWNMATAAVINGDAAAQVMGDWAQGEFRLAGQVAGQDYDCLMGMGGDPVISTAGDAFYFPVIDDPDVRAAQLELARVLLEPATQIAFNSRKGSLPVRGDVDIADANACMRHGLDVLAEGGTIDSIDMLISPDAVGQFRDLLAEFFATDMDAATAQERFAAIIANDM